jgi:hypothetical protein
MPHGPGRRLHHLLRGTAPVTLWLLILALADPGRKPTQDTCERKPGVAQCVSTERAHEGRWKCKASCYTSGREDGGVFSHLIKAEGATEEACKKTLNDMAARGCQ